MIKRGQVAVNPTTNPDLPANEVEEVTPVPPAAVAKLLAALPQEERAVWATAVFGGLRSGELRAIRWKYIDLDEGVMTVLRAWGDEDEGAPKSKAGVRRVPIVPQLHGYLAAHKTATGRDGDDLGVRANGRQAVLPLHDPQPSPQGVDGSEARTGWPAPVPAYVRFADDRGRMQRQGALDRPRTRLHRVYLQPLRPPDAAHAFLRDPGVDVSDIQTFPWGRFCFFSDPDGNGWSVHEPPLPGQRRSRPTTGVGFAGPARPLREPATSPAPDKRDALQLVQDLPGITTAGVARRLDVPLGQAHRIVGQLEQRGYVRGAQQRAAPPPRRAGNTSLWPCWSEATATR